MNSNQHSSKKCISNWCSHDNSLLIYLDLIVFPSKICHRYVCILHRMDDLVELYLLDTRVICALM